MRILWSLIVLCLVAVSGVERAGAQRTERTEEVVGTAAVGHELLARVGAHPTTGRQCGPERHLPVAIVVDPFRLPPRIVHAVGTRHRAPSSFAGSLTLARSARGPPIA